MIDNYLSSCNATLKVEKRKDKVPDMCYYQMKWRKTKNFQTLTENKRRIDALGITNYSKKYSLMPENGLLPNAKIVILVIVRWSDRGSRMFLRNTVKNKVDDMQHMAQLLFVFGLPKHASNYEFAQIKAENDLYHDMIVPGKSVKLY